MSYLLSGFNWETLCECGQCCSLGWPHITTMDGLSRQNQSHFSVPYIFHVVCSNRASVLFKNIFLYLGHFPKGSIMAFWGALCLSTLLLFRGKGDVSSYFWLLIYWIGNVDASSRSASYLKAELEQNGLQINMSTTVTWITQGERSQLHSLYYTMNQKSSQTNCIKLFYSNQIRFDLSGIRGCCLLWLLSSHWLKRLTVALNVTLLQKVTLSGHHWHITNENELVGLRNTPSAIFICILLPFQTVTNLWIS